jgi:hypothetical protein
MLLSDLTTDDFQKRGDNYPKSNIPVSIDAYEEEIVFLFKNTTEGSAKKWCKNFTDQKSTLIGFKVISIESAQTGDYQDDWVEVYVKIK